MVLQDCPLLMLAQGQTWSFTPVSAWRGERPPIRHRSRRATFPRRGRGLRAALEPPLYGTFSHFVGARIASPPASYRPLFCQGRRNDAVGCARHAPPPKRKRRSAELEKFSRSSLLLYVVVILGGTAGFLSQLLSGAAAELRHLIPVGDDRAYHGGGGKRPGPRSSVRNGRPS